MCSRYTYTKDEAKLRLRDLIQVFGVVPRANLRPTDLGPVILPEHRRLCVPGIALGVGCAVGHAPAHQCQE